MGRTGGHRALRGPEWRAAFCDAVTRWRDRSFARIECRRGYPWLRQEFERRVGYAPDLDAPRSINEKVTWRKLHDRNQLFPVISGKVAVRGHLQRQLGAERAEPLLPKLGCHRPATAAAALWGAHWPKRSRRGMTICGWIS